jgi:hypothetical protein
MDPEQMTRMLSDIEADHDRLMAEHRTACEVAGVGTAEDRLRRLPARVASEVLRRADVPAVAVPADASPAVPRHATDRVRVPLSLRTFSFRTLGR